jgi:single-stranded-DNA-specific exonuclease
MSPIARSLWQVNHPPDRERAEALATALRIPHQLAELLVQRGVDDISTAKVFLRPSLDGLSDPAEFKDLPEAVGIIADSVRRGERIVVHGDYDVDGQCGTALLTRVLRAAGGEVIPFVPHRMQDGYDLGPAGVAIAVEHDASLIVTCDCGVTASESVADAKRRGLKVVVTDHHLTGDLPPADAVVNPRRPDCPSPSKDLCGTGIVFKIAQGLVSELGLPENLPMHFLDLVALATVADLVPLTGENRTLVRFGLRTLANSRWPGVRALVEAAGLRGKPIRAGQVGFILAPRLNAIGRLGDAKDGLRLLLTDDDNEARQRAQALESINRERQELDQRILVEAIEHIEATVDLDRVFGLALARDGWHPGVIGIVASRLVERYARPTVLIGLEGSQGKGSGRSIPGFDLHGALTECRSHLVKFGGHRMAAGLTIDRDCVSDFQNAFNEAARRVLTFDDLVHRQRIDALVSLGGLDGRLERLLRYFEPCGMGNPAPVFGIQHAKASGARTVGESHLRFTLEDNTGRLAAIGFGLAQKVEGEWLDAPVNVAFRLEENEWQGMSSLQARVLDLRPPDE